MQIKIRNNDFAEYFIKLSLILFFAVILSGCKSKDSTSSTPTTVERLSFTINGNVIKGPVSGANVTAYRIIDGQLDSQLASVTTDSNGSFSLSYFDFSGSILIEATQGQYLDEATATTIELNTPLRVVLPSVSNTSAISVTPLTEFATRHMQSNYNTENIEQSNLLISQLFSGADPSSTINVTTTVPASTTVVFPTNSTEAEQAYALLMAMISQYSLNTNQGDLNLTMDDISDHIVQNNTFDTAVQNDLADALDEFLTSNANMTGVSESPLVDIIRSAGTNIPEVSDVLMNVAFDTQATGKLLAYQANGASLNFAITSNGSLGTAEITDTQTGNFTYTPATGATGKDELGFSVTNSSGYIAVAKVMINIAALGVNSSPVANNDWLDVLFATETSGSFNGGDPDNNTLTYRLENSGTKGTVLITDPHTGLFSYQPLITTGSDVIDYQVNDGIVDAANSGQISINILGGNSLFGGSFYINNCESCHADQLPKNTSAGIIKSALSNSTHQPAGFTFTDSELGDISAWLYGLNSGSSVDGGNAYDTYCSVCHGGNSTTGPTGSLKQNRSASEIRQAIITEATMNSLSTLAVRDIENIAAWLKTN